MAKIGNGCLDGFQGRIGPVVGYQWNGKWCMRSLPDRMTNPRTGRQMEHRSMFKQEVQLAAAMRWAVTPGLTDAARENGMTAYNLFVSINQPCFGISEGALQVDYSSLTLSAGPVAPVALGTPVIDDNNTLTVSFEKNPLGRSASGADMVHLFIFCPSLMMGETAEPVFRHAGRFAVALPDEFRDLELHLYAYVLDEHKRCSPSCYASPEAASGEAPVAAAADGGTAEEEPLALGYAKTFVETLPVDDPMQLSLW
ncbi:MAG: hypothetical protein IK058_05655 [Bacteroidales bacterium]|nr:hypothetical protein [Bacteroidales bacterium]